MERFARVRVFTAPLVVGLSLAAWPASAHAQTPADPAATQLVFTQTGRVLPVGDIYAGGYGPLVPFIQAGVAPGVQLGVGVPLFVLALGGQSLPIIVAPKVQLFAKGSVSIAAGTLHVFSRDRTPFCDGCVESFGLAYVSGTYGSAKNSVTIGLQRAYAIAPGRHASGASMINVSVEHSLSRTRAFITENNFGAGGGMNSAALRFRRGRLRFDLGGMLLWIHGAGAVAAPTINVAWRF